MKYACGYTAMESVLTGFRVGMDGIEMTV